MTADGAGRRTAGWAAAAAVIGGAFAAAAQDPAGRYAQADIESGARVYGAHCVRCHAETGDAVAGVDLATGVYTRAGSDAELMGLLRDGVPGTAMPPNDFTDIELTGLVAYLRTMRDPGVVAPGDPARGRALFAGRGACASCHRVFGEGARTAPDLSAIGAARTADHLRRSLLDPTGSMLPVNRPVRAVLRNGAVVTGRRLNEDTWSIQMIDQDERLRSLQKADLRELTAGAESPMPPATDLLDDQEVADVLAWLLTLRGL